jgi:hypothetical protein
MSRTGGVSRERRDLGVPSKGSKTWHQPELIFGPSGIVFSDFRSQGSNSLSALDFHREDFLEVVVNEPTEDLYVMTFRN